LKDFISFTSCFLSEYEESRGRGPAWATTVIDSVYSVSFHAASRQCYGSDGWDVMCRVAPLGQI
jgi:hypothetical protein